MLSSYEWTNGICMKVASKSVEISVYFQQKYGVRKNEMISINNVEETRYSNAWRKDQSYAANNFVLKKPCNHDSHFTYSVRILQYAGIQYKTVDNPAL